MSLSEAFHTHLIRGQAELTQTSRLASVLSQFATNKPKNSNSGHWAATSPSFYEASAYLLHFILGNSCKLEIAVLFYL